MTRAHMRWLIRREPRRQPRFGETRRDVTVWALRAAITQGQRRQLGEPHYFAHLTDAHAAATALAEIYYGVPTR